MTGFAQRCASGGWIHIGDQALDLPFIIGHVPNFDSALISTYCRHLRGEHTHIQTQPSAAASQHGAWCS